MASESPATGEHRLSFAKIAAMPAPSKPNASVATDERNGLQHFEIHPSPDAQGSKDSLPNQDSSTNAQLDESKSVDRGVDALSQAVQDARLTNRNPRQNSEASGDTHENGGLKRKTSFEDDQTHLSSSSTKPTSFDSKSMVSVATFAMDEKDSLRPDDSASVQAIDEEESVSGAASGAPNSLTGSESGARGFRDVSIHNPRAILQNAGSAYNDSIQRSNGTINPDSVSNNYVLPSSGPFQAERTLHGFPQDPDEKLLEAMKSPKDRLLILQLEDKVRNFIQHSKEQSLELPPSNAFGRLLAHKLGDYYHLTHFVDNNVTSVRLHRTPFCRLPAPLSALEPANNTPPPPVPAMKIMRRTDGERPSTDGSTTAGSIPASEAGDSGNERGGSSAGTSAKDRLTLTREEREAKYQEARERIFRDFPDSKSSDNSNGDQNANMSRSSSTSGRKKAQRQKTPHDDSFEARSQFNAYYPGIHYAQGPAPCNAAMNDPSYPSQPPYVVGPGVTPPGMGYVSSGQNGAMYSGPMHMNSISQYPMPVSPQMSSNVPWQGGNVPQQSPFSGYASMHSPAMINQQSSAKSSPALNNYAVPNSMSYQHTPPNWSSPAYHGNFPQPTYRNQPPVHWPNYPSQPMASNPTSYPYAQYPGQPLNVGMGMQNPHPASFARSPFNPQTRSFVPGGSGPMPRHPGKGNQPGISHYPAMHPGVQPQWNGFSDTGKHADARNAARGVSLNTRDSIAKWGTPSHLPPKPPPSEVPSGFELKPRNISISSDSHAGNAPSGSKNGPLVVSGGTSVPSRPN